eukprot:c39203_g1_i1 orf=332-703(+)
MAVFSQTAVFVFLVIALALSQTSSTSDVEELSTNRMVDSSDAEKRGTDVDTVQRSLAATTSPYDCAGKCNFRCSAARYNRRCLNYCNICCRICSCVPPFTSGHKDQCPCYNNLKNSKGGPKCP